MTKRNVTACTGEEGWCDECLHQNTKNCWMNFPLIKRKKRDELR